MDAYILIMILMTGINGEDGKVAQFNAPTVAQIEFGDREACEDARKLYTQRLPVKQDKTPGTVAAQVMAECHPKYLSEAVGG